MNRLHQKRKITSLTIFFLLILTIFTIGCTDNNESKPDEKIVYVDLNGEQDFQSIQRAVNVSSTNTTIIVAPGIYTENLVINKDVILTGEIKEETIIDGMDQGDVIFITENASLYLSNFTIRNSGENRKFPFNAGIKINSNHNQIRNIRFVQNSYGIVSFLGSNNNFSNNSFFNNSKAGLYLYNDEQDIVRRNHFQNNFYGLQIKGSKNTKIVENIFKQNQRGVFCCCSATDNSLYLNSFIQNKELQAYDEPNLENTWYHPQKGGNYWDDYAGVDSNNDGFGDQPYQISEDGLVKDEIPLIEPFIN